MLQPYDVCLVLLTHLVLHGGGETGAELGFPRSKRALQNVVLNLIKSRGTPRSRTFREFQSTWTHLIDPRIAALYDKMLNDLYNVDGILSKLNEVWQDVADDVVLKSPSPTRRALVCWTVSEKLQRFFVINAVLWLCQSLRCFVAGVGGGGSDVRGGVNKLDILPQVLNAPSDIDQLHQNFDSFLANVADPPADYAYEFTKSQVHSGHNYGSWIKMPASDAPRITRTDIHGDDDIYKGIKALSDPDYLPCPWTSDAITQVVESHGSKNPADDVGPWRATMRLNHTDHMSQTSNVVARNSMLSMFSDSRTGLEHDYNTSLSNSKMSMRTSRLAAGALHGNIPVSRTENMLADALIRHLDPPVTMKVTQDPVTDDFVLPLPDPYAVHMFSCQEMKMLWRQQLARSDLFVLSTEKREKRVGKAWLHLMDYGALSLATYYSKIGNHHDARVAVNDVIMQAQERGDRMCLAYALYISLRISVESGDLNDIEAIRQTARDCARYAKTMGLSDVIAALHSVGARLSNVRRYHSNQALLINCMYSVDVDDAVFNSIVA